MKNIIKSQIFDDWDVTLQQYTKPRTTITSHFLSERKGDRYV